MVGVVEGDSEEVMERMGQLEDMRAEWHQRKTLEHYIHRAPPELFGVETVSGGGGSQERVGTKLGEIHI